jgi:hypothetical protein
MKIIRNEAQLWQMMRSDVIAPNDHASRIESHATSPGVFDVNWKPNTSAELWVELKCYTADRKVHVLLSSQYRWGMDRHLAGGNCFILSSIYWEGIQRYCITKPEKFLEFKEITEKQNKPNTNFVNLILSTGDVYDDPSKIRFNP